VFVTRRVQHDADDRHELLLGGNGGMRAQPVARQDFQRLHVVAGFAAHHRTHTAGVVADHAAGRIMGARGRIGRERQRVLFRRVVRIEFENVVQMFRQIHYHGDIAGLPDEAGAAIAREGRAEFVTRGDSRDHIVDALGRHYTDRYLPTDQTFSRVQHAATWMESNFSKDSGAQ